MPLSSGTYLGPYEILAPLSAGGMGEVYRARDTRLEGSNFEAGMPKSLLDMRRFGPAGRNRYVPSPDGRRFLFVTALEATSSRPFVVVLNWGAGRAWR